jgi:hypothetical protein
MRGAISARESSMSAEARLLSVIPLLLNYMPTDQLLEWATRVRELSR